MACQGLGVARLLPHLFAEAHSAFFMPHVGTLGRRAATLGISTDRLFFIL